MKRIAIALAVCASAAAMADEGMWTYNNFPSAKVKAKYGFSPDPGVARARAPLVGAPRRRLLGAASCRRTAW